MAGAWGTPRETPLGGWVGHEPCVFHPSRVSETTDKDDSDRGTASRGCPTSSTRRVRAATLERWAEMWRGLVPGRLTPARLR